MKNDIRGPFVSIRGSFSPKDARQKSARGAPKRANHALPSPPYSLLSTPGSLFSILTAKYMQIAPPRTSVARRV